MFGRGDWMATTDISVIVPLYHGLPYLDQMIKQVESAAKEYDGVIELLLSMTIPGKRLAQIFPPQK